MKRNKLMCLKRTMVLMLALALTVTMPCVSVAAASDNVQAYAIANSENIQEAINKKDIQSLISYYISRNADYYRQNGLNPDFKFFNVDNYIKGYSDVAALITSDKAVALEHYLTYGAIEGRRSGTAFDPIVAITVMPQLATLTPDEMLNAWIMATGKATTADYTLRVTLDENGKYIYTIDKNTSLTNYYSASGDSDISIPGNTSSDVILNKKSFTFLLYLCGTDLEGKPGDYQASASILKLLLGAYDEDNVNVMILAGGTDKWKNTYLNNLLGGRAEGETNKSAIFTINKAGVKQIVDSIILSRSDINSADDIWKLVYDYDKLRNNLDLIDTLINENTLTMVDGSLGRNKMNDQATLLSLLEASKKEWTKADSYGLSLWNHGGGSVEGVCFPDDENTKGLSISGIKQALEAAGFGSTASGKPYTLGLLAFDACLMGGVEVAAYLDDYYDIMYGSEEISYGDIDYYNVLNIANKRAGEDSLSYYLAIAILEDRFSNYEGTQEALATGAIFQSGQARGPLEKLNAAAAKLNAVASADSTDAKTIYRAIKYARVKAEQIGSASTRYGCKDYVDLKNFLQMLKIELDKVGLLNMNADLLKSIDEAIVASDNVTYANIFNYAEKGIYYNNKNSEELWYNKTFWNQVKGMDLCGANIYVPYYGTETGAITAALKVYEDTYAGNLAMGDYSTLINNYSNEYINSEAEKDRIKNLTEELMNGSDASNNQIMGYASMLDMSLENSAGGKVIRVTVKDYNSENAAPASDYSSGDAFVDLCDTMKTMLVYITRRAEAICKASGEEDLNRVYVDVVVGSKTVTYENLNGLQSSVNIFTDEVKSADVNVIKEIDYSDNNNPIDKKLYDFVTPSDIEGWSQKNDMIRLIVGEGKDASKYITVKGTAKVNGEYIVVYHLFEQGSNNYIYKGSTELEVTEGSLIVKEPITNAESITLYHQIIDKSTNRLAYAEEYTWNEDGETKAIEKLSGTKEYELNDSMEIAVESKTLDKIGKTEDNNYYFAISQEDEKNDDDVFANSSAKEAGYEESPDVFESIDKAMDTEINPENAEDGNPETNPEADNDADGDSTPDGADGTQE